MKRIRLILASPLYSVFYCNFFICYAIIVISPSLSLSAGFLSIGSTVR